MIAPEHDDGVFREAELIERGEEFADLRVGVAHAGVVAVTQGARGGRVEVLVLRHVAVTAEFAMTVVGVLGDAFHALTIVVEFEGCGIVEVPITLRGIERQVRLEKAHR